MSTSDPFLEERSASTAYRLRYPFLYEKTIPDLHRVKQVPQNSPGPQKHRH
jgi:hypothetical protein